MATRFWLPSTGAPPVSPAIDGNWDRSTYMGGGSGRGGTIGRKELPTYDRLQMVTVRPTSAFVTKQLPALITAADQRTILRQYVSAPMNAQTIAVGTIKGVIRAAYQLGFSGGTAFPTGVYVSARVVSRNGLTVRGTLFALQADGAAVTAVTTTLTDRKVPVGGALATTQVIASQGDRIVIEVGFGRSGSPTGGKTGSYGRLDFGVSASDLPEDETGTTQLSPWFELSQNIVWESAGGGVIDPGAGPASVSATPTPAVPSRAHDWEVFLCDRAGVPITQIDPLMGASGVVTVARNAAATLAGSIPANDESVAQMHTDGLRRLGLASAQARVIKGYRREGSSYVLRFCGHVTTVGITGQNDTALLVFVAADPLARLSKRFCRDTSGNLGIGFGQTPGGDIVRMLIDNANLLDKSGLQTDGGLIPALAARDAQFDGTKMVLDAIGELSSSSDGFDYWAAPIDHTDGNLCRLMLYAKPAGIGAARPDVRFGWMADPNSLTTFQAVGDGMKMANLVAAQLGDGTLPTIVQDAPSQALYGLLESPVSASGDQTDAAYLTGLATQALTPAPPTFIQQVSVNPETAPEPWTSFFIGDAVSVVAGEEAQGGVVSTMSVESFAVSIGDVERLTSLAARETP